MIVIVLTYYRDTSGPDIIGFCILEETVKPYFMQTLRKSLTFGIIPTLAQRSRAVLSTYLHYFS